MTDVTEIDGPTDSTLDNHRYLLMEVESNTWQSAVVKGTQLLERIKYELATEALSENLSPAIVWRQRPYLTSVTDLATTKITYYVKFALLTVPTIELGEIALDD